MRSLPCETTAVDPTSASGRLRLAAQVLVAGAAQVGRAVQQFVLLALITKHLGPEAYGTWAQVIVTLTLLSPIGMLLLEPAIVRFLPEARDERAGRALLLRFGLITIAGSAVVGVLLLVVAGPLLRLVVGTDAALPYVHLIAGLLAAEGLGVLTLAYWRARGRPVRFTVLSLGRDAGAAVVIAVLLLSGGDLAEVVMAYGVYLWGYALATFGGSVASGGWPGVTLSGARRQLRFVAPLVLNHPLGWAGKYANIYVISILLGSAPVGIYGAARHLTDVLGFLSGPISLVLAPALTALFVRRQTDEVRNGLRAGISYFLLGAVPLAWLIALYAWPVLRVLTSREVATAGAPLVPWLAAAMVLMGMYGILAETAYLVRRTWFFPPIWIMLAAMQLGLNVVLLPWVGLFGAALAELLGAVTVLACAVWLARSALGLWPDFAEAGKLAVAGLVAAVFAATSDPKRTGLGIVVYGVTYPIALVVTRARSFERVRRLALRRANLMTGQVV